MGQTPLFKIVAASPDASINGRPIVVPLDVYKHDLTITIPEKAYIAVILSNGELDYCFRSGKAGEILSRRFDDRLPAAVPKIPRIQFPGFLQNWSYLFGDTVFVHWKHPADKRVKYRVTVTDIFGDSLQTIEPATERSWVVHPVTLAAESDEIKEIQVMSLEEPTPVMQGMVVRPVKERSKLSVELSSYNKNTRDNLIVRAALFGLNNCQFDEGLLLYKLLKAKYTPSDPILKAFLDRRVKAYQLDRLDFR